MTGLAAVLAAALLFAYSNAGPLPSNVTLTSTTLPVDDCAGVQCAPRAGCKALHRPDACCPLYQCECELDGRVYGNGEKLVDPGDPCRVCYCQGGEVVCRRIACFRRDDCRPRAVPGRCCPEYDNCPLTGGSAMIAAIEDVSSIAPSSAAPPPPPPPRETPKQEITIKEITPVSEIPSFSDAKAKESVGMAASRAPIIVREATPPAQPESSASPQPTLSTDMNSAYDPGSETSKPTPDDELLDHNPAFPPLPDDLTHREDDMPEQVAEPEPDPATSIPSSENPPTTTLSTPGTPETLATTAHTALKASPMLNLRSAIPTEILNLPSSVHEDINGELDDITEVTTSPAETASNAKSKETRTTPHIFHLVPNAPVMETVTISTNHQTGVTPHDTVSLNTNRISTEQFSTDRPSTERASTAHVTTYRPSTSPVTTDAPNTDRITDRVSTERSNTDRASTNLPNTIQSSTKQVNSERSISTKRFATVQVSTDQPITKRMNTQRPKADRESTNQLMDDRVPSDQSSTSTTIENLTYHITTDDTKTERVVTDLLTTDPADTSRPIIEELSTNRASYDLVSTGGFNTDQPSINKFSIDQSKIDQLSTDRYDTKQPSIVQPSTDRLSTEPSTTDRTTFDYRVSTARLDIASPESAHDVTVAKTEFSSIPIETSDRKPQDTVKTIHMVDVSYKPVRASSDGTSTEMGVSAMTTVVKGVPLNTGLISNEHTTDVMSTVTAAPTVSVSAAEGAGAGVLGELIDLVGDVAAIGEPAGAGDQSQPVNAGYKSRHQPSANSIEEQPARRRSPEIEEDGDPLPEPVPPTRAEPTTRLPPIDGDGARPPAPPPPPAPQDIEIITRSYVPTISRRPTKLVESASATE